MKTISPEGKLIWEDCKKALNNALVFSTPLLITFLLAIQQGTPVKEAMVLVYMAAIQLLIDLLRKARKESVYTQ